jgi:hypothetical protein
MPKFVKSLRGLTPSCREFIITGDDFVSQDYPVSQSYAMRVALKNVFRKATNRAH